MGSEVPYWWYWEEYWGLQDSFMSNMAAEHSVITSSSSFSVSEVLRLRDLKTKKNKLLSTKKSCFLAALISFFRNHYAPATFKMWSLGLTLLWMVNYTATQILREVTFCELKRSKSVVFGNFRDSELWICVNLGLESCSNLLKSKFRTSKIVKINIFGPFELTKLWFHVKSEWR